MQATRKVDEVEHAFLKDGGEMGRRIAQHDWASTPIGGIEGWPISLKHTVSLMLASPVPLVLLWGEAGVMVYNDPYSVFAGGRDSRLLGSNVREGWEEVAAFNDNVMRVGLAGGTLSYRDHQLVLYRNGRAENVWLNLDYSPVRDDEGKPAGVIAVVVEITDSVHTRAALEKSEAQFAALAQNMPNQVWTARADGWLDWFNSRVYAYTGEVHGGLDGEAWLRMVHPDDVQVTAERWQAALASGSVFETEFRLRDATHVYRWHLSRAVPLLNAQGVITAWVGTNTDIDAQKRAEETYAQDRERLWTTSQDILLVCDYECRVTAINPSAQRLLGWTQEEMVGQLLTDFVHPDDVEDTAIEVAKIATGVPTLVYQNRYRTRDGEYRLLDWTAVPDGLRIHGVGRDITEQRSIEEALRQSQKMEAVGQLTGGIAHDFNNLLQGIIGGLDMIVSRLNQGRVADIPRWLSGARNSAERAAALTHRLLAFSRRQPLDPRPIDANPLVGSLEDMLRRTLGERIALQMNLAADLWSTRCDPNQLESAILNLAINARDAMPGGGVLTIETANATIDRNYAVREADVKPGQYVCIAVTDTGTGMSKSTIARAFEPFFTTKPIGQGTGLGLSMIYGFALQSEGHATIYSEPDRGTTVKLYLPRHLGLAENDEVPAEAPAPHESRSGEVVLVVEDEFLVRSLVVDVLEELGYAVIEAGDGDEGLRILQSGQRIDLLITDIGLPGLNGQQVADAGRAARSELKVLFMTGYAENAAIASGFLEPGMAMITKPFTLDVLTRRVREIIEG